ncbi:shikimate kinase [Litoreibacter arenae]|nr:shikimate kinase [Litoreibacter arenae]
MPPKAMTLTRPLVLVGMMGAGKTAIGGAVARKLGVGFLDSDEELVRAADRSIAEIFERDGEEFFRARETEVIARLLDGEPAVLSTGGGAFLSETNRAMIHDKAVSLLLKADLPLLWSRVRHKTTRPLLRTDNPRATLTEIYNARTPIYAKAQLSVEARPEYSIDDMADKVIATLHDAQLLKEKTP